MSLSQRLIVGTLKAITNLICRIDDNEMARIPLQGPLIIYTNHVNILEVPVFYTRVQPRLVHGLVLAKRWQNPVLRWMLDTVQAIPLHRAEADLAAIRQALDLLAQGAIVAIAPEGTRSHDGVLGLANPGVVLLALHSEAPLLPIAFHGGVSWLENLSRLRRTDFHLRVGRPFHLETHGQKVTRNMRKAMLGELMHQLAGLLPPEFRGRYAEPSTDSQKYLAFEL